jgi:hypothetical protein
MKSTQIAKASSKIFHIYFAQLVSALINILIRFKKLGHRKKIGYLMEWSESVVNMLLVKLLQSFQHFYEYPNIFIKFPIFSLSSQYFHSVPNIFIKFSAVENCHNEQKARSDRSCYFGSAG